MKKILLIEKVWDNRVDEERVEMLLKKLLKPMAAGTHLLITMEEVDNARYSYYLTPDEEEKSYETR